ncbi:hypothetical protein FSP39_015997 [Pinctada imbricata]|uniref:SCAN box domain-containing protein n=1 Tax=Pinctada imbricata TaxID=66713 RepID=A0AA89BJH0_PINIB|nr:hypothetical protein FSP39_015997 [Pinctada imbricata]
MVKGTILRAYQLVPEAYRQKFRKYKKFENQTYVEFAREKEDLFDQWFRSKKIPNSFDNLHQIILIEEFKECVHQDLRTHLEDKNVKTLEEAAVLSDTYAPTHKKNFVSKTQSSDSAKTSDFPKKNLQESQSSISSQSPSQGGSTSGPRSERSEASPGVGSLPTCNYCKKKGHVIGECLKRKKKKELKSQACASVRNDRKALDSICSDTPEIQGFKSSSDDFVEDHYKPFLSQGFVSLSDSSEALPVQILRDIGAAQTLLLEGSLPLSEHTFTENEDTQTEVIDMMKSEADTTVKPEEIVAIHRIPGKRVDQPRPILMKLKNSEVKSRIIRLRSVFKDARKGIRLADDVTMENTRLNERLNGHEMIESSWYFNGNVFGKVCGSGRKVKFQINDYDIEEKIKKSKSRR